jgi:hypothetical protein
MGKISSRNFYVLIEYVLVKQDVVSSIPAIFAIPLTLLGEGGRKRV